MHVYLSRARAARPLGRLKARNMTQTSVPYTAARNRTHDMAQSEHDHTYFMRRVRIAELICQWALVILIGWFVL